MMKTMEMAETNDALLVAESLSGNREAFGQIVARYQNLICSLAYSATGSLNQSEDLAQETFLAAWKQLSRLREPHKLRSWLCGIARNLTYDSLKKQGREPSHAGETLEVLETSAAIEPQPHDFAISQEEESILWRSMEQIPEIYREPLVLFYRQQQSIEAVAQNLELTEDAVKQRLSRGRKLLHEQVLTFVEGALARTNPGKTFTIGVIAALPALASSAKAATIATAAAKGGTAAKSTGLLGILGALAGPLFVLFGNYIPYRMTMASAHSDEERHRIRTFFKTVCIVALILSTLLFAGLYSMFRSKYRNEVTALNLFETWFVCFVLMYLLSIGFATVFTSRKQRRHLAFVLAKEHQGSFPAAAWEYRSQSEFLGLPLVHIRIGDRFAFLRPPVKAWIAVGQHAIGGIFAFGGTAMAPIAIGGMALGLVTLGGLVAGLIPFGGFAFGAGAFGGFAIGWQASGFCAVAWNAARGSFALAHDYALGNFAHALQVNTEAAHRFIQSSTFFQFVEFMNHHWFWTNFLWITPLFLQWRVIARQRRREQFAR